MNSPILASEVADSLTIFGQRHPSQQQLFKRRLPELIELERMIDKLRNHGRINIETTVQYQGMNFPIYSLEFGPQEKNTPVIILVGGVHGLERIGSRIIIEYLKTFKELLYWDQLLDYTLENCRILFYPIVNPVGIFAKTRSNGQGVDLMRNSPVESHEVVKHRLVAGHRISPLLPWYRGRVEEGMQLEATALCNFVERNIMTAPFAITLDLHSGFGMVDRLWFPYARSQKPFEHYVEMFALKRKIDQALPNHVYHIEPQSLNYVTHGDMWDHVYHTFLERNSQAVYLPLTLEMGSWNWLRKNPRQIFNILGMFHPVKPHRTRRTLRRHISLVDLLIRATTSYKRWMNPPPSKRVSYAADARASWYNTPLLP